MTISEVRDILGADLLTGQESLRTKISLVCACDLMSDVLAFVQPGAMLLTGLTNPQVVRTAEVADVGVICFVRGKHPPPETLRLAQEKRIPILRTPLSLYEACGRLHAAGAAGS